MSINQLPMEFSAPPLETSPSAASSCAASWLGVTLDHRVLFESLQDLWLRPPEGALGQILQIGGFPRRDEQPTDGHRIFVRVKFEIKRLPHIQALAYEGGEWLSKPVSSNGAEGRFVFWPGALPTFAISELLVKSDEECARLSGLAAQVSNVALPVAPRVSQAGSDDTTPRLQPPAEVDSSINPTDQMDAQRGALAMAVWAVPRVDPWLDLLCQSLGVSYSPLKMTCTAEGVISPWWTLFPWKTGTQTAGYLSTQESLWVAALSVFDIARNGPAMSAADLVRDIASNANQRVSSNSFGEIHEWVEETIKVLRGDIRLEMANWKAVPVGKAIQLVLARRNPIAFRTWKDDLPSLPPTVWFSAATLAGYLTGYRRLPLVFRGDAVEQMLFAIYGLSISSDYSLPENWANLIKTDPKWHREKEEIVLSWSGVVFSRKTENARTQWFNADFDDSAITQKAIELSRSYKWPCVWTNVRLPAGCLKISGGAVELVFAETPELKFDGPRELILPPTVSMETNLDREAFRRFVATEGAVLPAIGDPTSKAPLFDTLGESRTLPTKRAVVSTPLAKSAPAPNRQDIPGLVYVRDFLTEAEENQLVNLIDAGEWSSELKRRVQQFGWRYDYRSRELDSSMRLGPLPDWAMKLAQRLREKGLLPHIADQVIVNEYVRNQGIARHIDCVPCFADGIAMISLLESWEMVFRDKGGRAKIGKILERGSVAIMSGAARYEWSHEIAARSREPNGKERRRRISITLRKVDDGAVRENPRFRR